MDPFVRIRPASTGDEAALLALFNDVQNYHAELAPHLFQATPNPQALEAFLFELIQTQELDVLVAEIDGTVCGFAAVGERSAPPLPIVVARRWAHLNMIGVAAEFRGRGVGTRLLEAVERWALERGLDEVELHVWEANASAVRFYERANFSTLQRTMFRAL